MRCKICNTPIGVRKSWDYCKDCDTFHFLLRDPVEPPKFEATDPDKEGAITPLVLQGTQPVTLLELLNTYPELRDTIEDKNFAEYWKDEEN